MNGCHCLVEGGEAVVVEMLGQSTQLCWEFNCPTCNRGRRVAARSGESFVTSRTTCNLPSRTPRTLPPSILSPRRGSPRSSYSIAKPAKNSPRWVSNSFSRSSRMKLPRLSKRGRSRTNSVARLPLYVCIILLYYFQLTFFRMREEPRNHFPCLELTFCQVYEHLQFPYRRAFRWPTAHERKWRNNISLDGNVLPNPPHGRQWHQTSVRL